MTDSLSLKPTSINDNVEMLKHSERCDEKQKKVKKMWVYQTDYIVITFNHVTACFSNFVPL